MKKKKVRTKRKTIISFHKNFLKKMGENIKSVEIESEKKTGELTALLNKKFPKAVLDFHSYRSEMKPLL